LPLRGIGPLFYALQRFQLGGLAPARYLAFVWLAIAGLAAIAIIPGQWFTVAAALLLLVAQLALGVRYRRQQYVTFASEPIPDLSTDPLDVNEKISIYATGLLSVEGRYQQYSAIPGFYRTFATGEHALLCRVQERNWLGLWCWPLEETGMWYTFVKPSEIRALQWGKLHFGVTTLPAIALTYQLEIPSGPRRKRVEVRQELIYISTPEVQDAQRVYADLLNNLPAEVVAQETTSLRIAS
jgi:hypothetical protein